MPFQAKCAYAHEATDEEIVGSVGILLQGAVGGVFLVTTRKMRLFMERRGYVSSSRHISAVLARAAEVQGWRKVELRYHASNHSPCLGYFVRRG